MDDAVRAVLVATFGLRIIVVFESIGSIAVAHEMSHGGDYCPDWRLRGTVVRIQADEITLGRASGGGGGGSGGRVGGGSSLLLLLGQ